RRRHTRFSRDWSSDVCSSDLRFALFADEAVLALHGAAVRAALPDAAICTVPSGEAAKTLAWAERLWGFLIEGGFGRNDVAVALEIGRASCRERGCRHGDPCPR